VGTDPEIAVFNAALEDTSAGRRRQRLDGLRIERQARKAQADPPFHEGAIRSQQGRRCFVGGLVHVSDVHTEMTRHRGRDIGGGHYLPQTTLMVPVCKSEWTAVLGVAPAGGVSAKKKPTEEMGEIS